MEREQRIPWKRRPDLLMHPSDSGVHRATWVIKDPITLDYFMLSDSEFAIFSALDGRKSLHDYAALLGRTHDGEFESELKAFLNKLISSNLVLSTALGYGRLVAQRSARKLSSAARTLSKFNIVSFRWRGFDPQKFLERLDQLVGWLYSPTVFALSFVLFAGAIVALLHQSLQPEFTHLDVRPILTFQNLPLLMLSIVVIKILHEIAHGLTCVHYGGECHELGMLFILFFPLLYCDTTDSWLKQSRWQRAQVAGAGMFVELVIASICCLLWASSVPGILHTMFLNIMLVCSINTVLVNGNPLLRYDGYYLVSDLLNRPNLGPDARALTQSWFDRIVYGSPLPTGTEMSIWNLSLGLYSIASAIYRITVLMAIGWGVHHFLKQSGLEQLTLFILAPMMLSIIFSISFSALRRGQLIAREETRRRKWRAIIGMIGLLVSIAVVISLPLPHTVIVPFTFEPGLCRPVYVTVPGQLKSIVPVGASVTTGDVLAELQNGEVELAVAHTAAELALRELHLKNLETFRSSSRLASNSLPAASEALSIARQRYDAEQLSQSRLTVRSPASGLFFPSRNLSEDQTSPRDIRFWQDRPTDKENRSAWLRELTILGWVGSPADFRGVAYIPQDQIEFVRHRADTRLTFLSAPDALCRGEVTEIGTERVETLPREIVHNQLAAVDPLAGQMKPVSTLYRVQIQLTEGSVGTLYSTGFAKIECTPLSIAARLWRLVKHTFAIEA